MTYDVASPLEDRLRAALTKVAEQVSIDLEQLPTMAFDEGPRRAPSRRTRTFAVAALAAALAVVVVFAVNNVRSTDDARPTPASTPSTTPPTKPPNPAVALRCPSKPLASSEHHHQVPGTKTTMVPGRPIALLACRYHGFNQPEPIGTLAKSASFDAGRMADDLNAQPPIPPGVVSNCPADFGETIVLLFGYADNSRLTVSISTAGCRYATNGDRIIHMDPVELARLLAVLGKDASP